MTKPFLEYRKVCPKCFSRKFSRRKDFHLFSKYHCHNCHSNFFQPTKQKVVTSSNQKSININRHNQSIIRHKR